MPVSTSILSKSRLFQQYARELDNPVALVLRAAEGVPISVFDALLQLTGLSKNQLASFIDVTPKTIDNYRTHRSKLGRTESEQLLQIMALYKKGGEVFGSAEAFNHWLAEPAFGLGGIKPFDLMYTQGGIQLIMEELLRIEFGALA